MERPSFRRPAPVKLMFPTGGLVDIPTGDYVEGTHNQRVLNGGIGMITGFVGPGNSFKTTTMRWMEFTVLSRLIQTVTSLWATGYDTEINSHENRNLSLSYSMAAFKGRNIIDEGIWTLTDKTVYSGNEMWDVIKKNAKAKREQKNALCYKTAFLDRDGVSPMMTMQPTFTDFDSLTHFITDNVSDQLEKVELGDSKGNTVYMNMGRVKAAMLMEMPTVAGASNDYFLFTAHIGEKIEMPSGPTAAPPRKQLQHMPQGVYIKGVTNNFFYLLHNCWFISNARPFLTKDRTPEYPYEQGDEVPGDLDLNIVTLKQLRGKNGQSGFTIDLIISQKEGVLPSLTEFHYLRESKQFGMLGNVQNYQMALLPEVSLRRTTIRQKLRESHELRRAVEITSQIAQLYEYKRELKDQLMMPEELYTAIKAKGYDWDFILKQTRGWHTLNDEEHPGWPWSTMDLIRAARGEYHPYYLEDDCKTIKPEFAKIKLEGTF